MQLKILFSMLKILYHKIRGSKGGSHNLQSTEGKSQLGRSGFKIGFELKISLINFERSPLVLTE
jgi:hypothetical protein